MEEVITTKGYVRLVLVPDRDSKEPYDEGGSPILAWSGSGLRGGFSQIAITSYKLDPRIFDAVRTWGFDEPFRRYLRIFHGVTEIIEYKHEGITYLSFDPESWRREMGLTEEQLRVSSEVTLVTLQEWKAYCEGEVYGYEVQRRLVWTRADDPNNERDTWETVDSCWGFYGRDSAIEAGKEALDAYAQSVPSAEQQLILARRVLSGAEEGFWVAVRRLVVEKVVAVYPTAVQISLYGEYNEDGLLHTNLDRVMDADGRRLRDGQWDDLTNVVDPLLHELSERDPEMSGQTTWDVSDVVVTPEPEVEFEIQGNYGHGWEMVTTEATREAAEAQLATYNTEEPHIPHRVHRVPAQDSTEGS